MMQKISRQVPQCGSCFAAGARVVEESASSQQAAIARYSELFALGYAPALCQRQCGSFLVCYVEAGAMRKAA